MVSFLVFEGTIVFSMCELVAVHLLIGRIEKKKY